MLNSLLESHKQHLIKGHMHHIDAEAGDSPFQKKNTSNIYYIIIGFF
jgi:hypothetical protein